MYHVCVPNVMAIHAIVEILHSKPPMWTSWWSYQSLRIHSSGTMIVSTKVHGIPTSGGSDIKQRTVRLPFMQPYMPLLCLKIVACHSFCLHLRWRGTRETRSYAAWGLVFTLQLKTNWYGGQSNWVEHVPFFKRCSILKLMIRSVFLSDLYYRSYLTPCPHRLTLQVHCRIFCILW